MIAIHTTSRRFFAAIAITALIVPSAMAQGNSGNNRGNSGNSGNQPSQLPIEPVGWIDAYPTIVQSGTHPTVSWGINVPSMVGDVIRIENDEVIVESETCLECRILGNGVTAHWSDGYWEFVPAGAYVSHNGGSFQEVFMGSNPQVNPNTIVWQRSKMQPGERLRFGGRYVFRGTQGPWFHTNDGTRNVRTLVNGQAPPIYTTNEGVPSLEDFIEPYLDANGNVRIGPMDFIVFMELTHTSAQSDHHGYDFQDMVLICTAKVKAKNNNRSGLADGTNPGQGNQMGNNNGTNNPNNAPHSGGSGN